MSERCERESARERERERGEREERERRERRERGERDGRKLRDSALHMHVLSHLQTMALSHLPSYLHLHTTHQSLVMLACP